MVKIRLLGPKPFPINEKNDNVYSLLFHLLFLSASTFFSLLSFSPLFLTSVSFILSLSHTHTHKHCLLSSSAFYPPYIFCLFNTLMGRAPCCDRATVKRGPWSPDEDEILKGYIEKNGTGGNWIALPHKAGTDCLCKMYIFTFFLHMFVQNFVYSESMIPAIKQGFDRTSCLALQFLVKLLPFVSPTAASLLSSTIVLISLAVKQR
jgi:hypothetical protein